jgi:glycogen debranching enzyme
MRQVASLKGFLLLSWAALATAQAPPPPLSVSIPSVTAFQMNAPDLPSITREVAPIKPFSVIGPRGALLGQQDGSYEAWIFPWKIFSDMRIAAEMQDYPVPFDVNEHAAEIEVQPNCTTITYSHANFTIRQTMIAPKEGATNTGVMVFYQIQAVRPMKLTFTFHPVMQRMWPAQSDDVPSPEWVESDGGRSGFYILHLNFPDYAAAVAIPGAQAGIHAPYQERPRDWPLQFVLSFDPKIDSGKVFPLLLMFANTVQTTDKMTMAQMLLELNRSAPSIFATNEKYYRELVNTATSIETPDASLNDAFTWAVAAIDQLRVKTTPDLSEEALTAGFGSSGNAARPGFGWFFGRDALWSLFAVNSYGDFSTTKAQIEFLFTRQRADGKIMHEWSQTANLVDWKALPYEYASADATLLLQMAVDDYVRISGDTKFAAAHWEQLLRGWQFVTSHVSPDGIYNNLQGSGWVESWIPVVPHQEIYLAALDEQASAAFANLARLTGHADLAKEAEQRAAQIGPVIEREYYLPQSSTYAFSRNDDGSTDATATIFPSVAWWDGNFGLKQAEPMFARWASSEFSTDWGTRLLSNKTAFYDPISYHQGSVWPLFNGWVSVAEYRAGHPLSGYAHLMQNADLSYAQDLGAVTELLSGEFYQVLGRSTAHQLWSSAMVISPILRGMFGLQWDESRHELSVSPHLPADWSAATIHRLPFGSSRVDLTMRRDGQTLVIAASGPGAAGLHLASQLAGVKEGQGELRVPLPAVEVYTGHELPVFGSETHQMKVLSERYEGRSLKLVLSAPAGTVQSLGVRVNELDLHPRFENAQVGVISDGLGRFTVAFPAGNDVVPFAASYVNQAVSISW